MERRSIPLEDALDLILDHRGRTPKKLGSDWADEGVQVISAKLMSEGRLNLSREKRYVTEATWQKWMPTKLQSGDVLLTSEAPLGEAAYLSSSAPLCLGQRLFALRANREVLDGRYLYYLLRSGEGRALLEQRASGTTVTGIRQSELRKILIDLPPMRDQVAISQVLGALDDKIDVNKRLVACLEAELHAELAICGLREQAPFTSVIDVNPQRKLKRGVSAPYLGMSDVPTASALAPRPDDRAYTSGTRFMNGDTLMARITPCLENGKTCFVDFLGQDVVGWGSTEFLVLRAMDGFPVALPYFLARRADVRDHAVANMTGTSGRQRCPASAFDKFAIWLPSGLDLTRWGVMADQSLEVMRSLEDENATLAELRDALLPKLLSGEIRVGDAEDLVEESV